MRIFFGLGLMFLVILFLYLKVVPSGQISYSRTWPRGLASGKGFIYDFKPGERLDISDPDRLRMIGDPLYFSLFTPRAFSEARVTVTYRDKLSSATPLIELGVLKDKVTGNYELRPLENKIIDELSSDWKELADQDQTATAVYLLQSKNNYQTVKDFLADLNKRNLKDCPDGPEACLAVYNYQLRGDYRPTGPIRVDDYTFNQPVRGAHQLYIYLPSGSQEINMSVVDLNLDPDPDRLTVRLSLDGQEVLSHILDDERAETTGVSSEVMNINLPVTSAGALYKLDVRASDDIVISSFTFPTDQFVFINRIWPVSGSGNLKLFTDSSHLQIKTFNPASLGPISFGGKKHEISKTYQQLDVSASQAVSEIYLPKDDIIVETNGVFSVSRERLFNPAYKKIDRFFNPGEPIKYILANYTKPLVNGELKAATAELSLSDAHREDGSYTFLISVPGLGANTPGTYLEINEINIELKGRNLWEKIKQWL